MIRCAAFAVLVISSSAVWADSWAPPSKETYQSPDKGTRLTVTPRDLESALSYFEDKVEGREPAGAPAGSKARSAAAMLERRSGSGRWEKAWTKPLTNDVSPVDVIVANGGQGFATLDNWHSMGSGPNAIAIYGSDGKLVRQLGLNELFPDWFVSALPHSVSSIQWRSDARISEDGTELIIPIVQPSNEELSYDDRRTVDLAIRMADGVPVGLDRPEWKEALTRAAATAREDCTMQRQAIKESNAPIAAPKTNKEEDWHRYLRESQFRTKWSEDPPYPGTTILRPPSATDFQASVKWLEEALNETAMIDHDLRAIGSPDIARLTTEIERIGTTIRPEQLKGVDLVIVADAAHADRIRAAFARSGARLEIIDPAQQFPQIEQRMQNEAELRVCLAPEGTKSEAAWWHALPFLALRSADFTAAPRIAS